MCSYTRRIPHKPEVPMGILWKSDVRGCHVLLYIANVYSSSSHQNVYLSPSGTSKQGHMFESTTHKTRLHDDDNRNLSTKLMLMSLVLTQHGAKQPNGFMQVLYSFMWIKNFKWDGSMVRWLHGVHKISPYTTRCSESAGWHYGFSVIVAHSDTLSQQGDTMGQQVWLTTFIS